MSTTYNLTNSATEVNTAIQAVVGADTTPDAASVNMVTSQGVFNHVNTELGPFKGKTITTESTGIAATDNDDSIPTSAAVKDYVDASTTTLTRTSALSTVDRYTAGFATIGSIPAGVYGIYGTYEYLNNQTNALTGEFRITIGTETLTDAIVPNTYTSSGSYNTFQPSTGYGGTIIETLQVKQILGGSVVLEVKRQSTYGGSATVQVRNFTLKFVKIA